MVDAYKLSNPKEHKPAGVLAKYYYDEKNYDKSIELYNDAINRSVSKNIKAYYYKQIAMVYNDKGQSSESNKYLKKAQKLNPGIDDLKNE
jgi:tetratricopeptide (TPR) repeat protein